MPTPPSKTRRKKPICRQCGTRMVGHKRGVQGSPICPQKLSSLASPPQSPTTPLRPFEFVPDPAFYTEMKCGTLRRVNPNFVDKKVPIPELLRLSAAGSLVPTVLVDDDGNTIRGSNHGGDLPSDEEDDVDYEDDEDEDEDECCLDNALLDIPHPMLTIFRTKDKDLAKMQETAVRMGVHYGIMTPPNTPPNKKTLNRNQNLSTPLTRNDSWWVVMGQSASFVQEVIDACQKGMPGTIAKDESELREPFRTTTFLQLVFAGLVGGCVVVCGLSML